MSARPLRSPLRLSPVTLRSMSTGTCFTLLSPLRLSGVTRRSLRRLPFIFPSIINLRYSTAIRAMAQEDYATLSWGQHEALQGAGGVAVLLVDTCQ